MTTLARPEDAVHGLRAALQDRPDLLAVDQLGDDGALVADQPGDLFHRDAAIRQQRREIREEAGLAIESIALTGVYKNMARSIIALVFRCRAVNGILTPNREVADFH